MKTECLKLILFVALAVGLSGCSGLLTESEPSVAIVESLPAGFPSKRYQDLAADERLYRIDEARSSLLIQVYRAGRLKRLGHNHILAARGLAGQVVWSESLEKRRADLYFPVAKLEVDNAELRKQAGPEFSSVPSETDVVGTKRNLLSETQLNAQVYPFVRIELTALELVGEIARAKVDFVVRDKKVSKVVEFRLLTSAQAIEAKGQLLFNLSEFGIEPYSVLGGALSVADEIRVRFAFLASAIDNNAGN